MAVGMRGKHDGLIAHTDRGSQYASDDYQAALKAAGFVCSMSCKGDCWDNAPAESFFATIKTESLYGQTFATRADAHDAIIEFTRWYYATRRHSTLGYVSPAAFERGDTIQHLAA